MGGNSCCSRKSNKTNKGTYTMKQQVLDFDKPILEILRPIPQTESKKIKNKLKNSRNQPIYFLDF